MSEIRKTPTAETDKDQPGKSRQENPQVQARLTEISNKLLQLQKENERSYLEQGRLLLEAKALFGPHGEWIPWLQKNVDMSVCKAQRLMKIARWIDRNEAPVPHLPFTQAYVLTKLSREKINNFLEWLKAENAGSEPFQIIQTMGKRDLDKAIREYLSSSTAVPHTRKGKKTEVNSPATTPVDKALDTLCQLETTMSGLVENVTNRQVDDEIYETLISEIRKLCEDTLGKLPAEDVAFE